MCLSVHQDCYNLIDTLLPKRVVEIESENNGDGIKIYEQQQGAAQRGGYLALSHCWGGYDILKTTSSNLAEMKKQINWQSLPQTFQDVITVARQLKIRWVWIDSLCIVQDDPTDWESESIKMGSYYENAFLTVAATSSPDPMTPFLCARKPADLSKSFETHHRGRLYPLMVRPILRERFGSKNWEGKIMDQTLEHKFGPLSTRAWAWQENALARRIVHYTATGLVYECRGEEAVHIEDCSPLPTAWLSSLPRAMLDKELDPFNRWHVYIQSYSQRNLTFTSDKLPAVAGVAEKIFQLTGSPYVAGLWKDNLVRDLLWSADDWATGYNGGPSNPPLPPIPTQNGSPSWSWASLTGRLKFNCSKFHSNGRPLISIHAAEATLRSSNPFGQVSSGSITLTGFFVTVQTSSSIRSSKTHHEYVHTQNYQTRFSIVTDTILEDWEMRAETGEIEKSLRRSNMKVRPMTSGQGFFDNSVLLHCLMIYEEDGVVHGLVLVPADAVKGAYIRIGYFSDDKSWNDMQKVERSIIIV